MADRSQDPLLSAKTLMTSSDWLVIGNITSQSHSGELLRLWIGRKLDRIFAQQARGDYVPPRSIDLRNACGVLFDEANNGRVELIRALPIGRMASFGYDDKAAARDCLME